VPITADKLLEAASLTTKLSQFHIIVDHPDTLERVLAEPPAPAGEQWSIFIMV